MSTFNTVAANLTALQREFIDDIYKDNNKNNESYQLLIKIRQPIGNANVKNITSKIISLNKLKHLKFESLQFESLDLSYIEKLSKLSYHYDRSSIRRIKPDSKRYTMLACHLHEITKSAIDEIIDANDKLLGEIERRVNRDFDKCYKKLKNNAKISRDLALRTLRGLLNHQQCESQ